MAPPLLAAHRAAFLSLAPQAGSVARRVVDVLEKVRSSSGWKFKIKWDVGTPPMLPLGALLHADGSQAIGPLRRFAAKEGRGWTDYKTGG